ncbi:hypothetical protein SDC9_138388 [bioreactor metagenome]|uniref:Uncharacterized protein n=1 Tax=bioreactor metagenome TaxID=1076179 RepID=A0A645DPP3_9ZZZZ
MIQLCTTDAKLLIFKHNAIFRYFVEKDRIAQVRLGYTQTGQHKFFYSDRAIDVQGSIAALKSPTAQKARQSEYMISMQMGDEDFFHFPGSDGCFEYTLLCTLPAVKKPDGIAFIQQLQCYTGKISAGGRNTCSCA